LYQLIGGKNIVLPMTK